MTSCTCLPDLLHPTRLRLLLLAALACLAPHVAAFGDEPPVAAPAPEEPPVVAPAPEEPPVAAPAMAAEPPGIQPEWIEALKWRSIGPAAMGGRIVDLAVVESDPSTFYVATASGGLFRTINNGTTFEPVFEKESTVSIGDVCVAPSQPDVVWVGTGEHNARNSVSWGDGVYKSTDGGKTWQHMGLKESFQIGRIAIHPRNPDVVYVAALGRLWGSNAQRGLFKTSDGGKTWEKVLYVDEKTGCVDVVMHPDDPDTLLAAMYERQRDEFDGGDPAKRWGPGSGIYKTTDGGKSWNKLSAGLPTVKMGRIGLACYRREPETVYAIIETEKIGQGQANAAFMGITGAAKNDSGAALQGVAPNGPAAKAGLKAGDTITHLGDKKIASYNDLVVAIRGHKADDEVTVQYLRGDEPGELQLTFGRRPGNNRRAYASNLGGQRENAQEQQGPDGHETGGVFKSTDGGETWQRINSLNPRPFYYSQIHVDPSDDKYIYVMGINLHATSDGGKTFRSDLGRGVHPDHHAMWIDPRDGRHLILGGDGGLYISYDRGKTWDFTAIMAIGQFYHVAVDNRPLYRVYGGLQDNGSWGGPSRTRRRNGPVNADWTMVGGADGFVCQADPEDPDLVYYEGQYGMMGRVNIRTGERARIRPPGRFRFNWKTPFTLSHHNSRIFYCAGNHVFRSLNRGERLQQVSPEISRTDRGSATALAESRFDPDVLYVGTDDGALWVTRDGGHTWQNITDRVPSLPGPRHVSAIETSRHRAGRTYVTFDGHRSDDDAPYVYVTGDEGHTWRSLVANLPQGSTRAVREDAENPQLLYLGTEFGIWCSADRGRSWLRLNSNLPTVAVHEIAVHPTAGEIVAGTHGRSLWVLDVTPLRQLTEEVRTADAHLFAPPPAVRWSGALNRFRFGHRQFSGENPDAGAALHYYLASAARAAAVTIHDLKGNLLRRMPAPKGRGLHRVNWDLRRAGPQQRGQPGRRRRFGPPVPPGTYVARLTVDGREFSQEFTVEADPQFPAAMLLEELEQHESKQRPTTYD